MQMNSRTLALILAIAVAVLFILIFPNYILELGLEPTGMPLREFYQAQTVADLPESIRSIMLYQYPLALLLAIAAFGAVYFGDQALSIDITHGIFVLIICLIPIATFLFWPLLFVTPLIVLGLLIWMIWLYLTHQPLLISYAFCWAINAIAAIGLWKFFDDVFAIIT